MPPIIAAGASLMLLAPGADANPFVDFAPANNFSAGFQPHQAALGDLNGDGNLDVATVSFSSNGESVLMGNGDGTFVPRPAYRAGAGAVFIAIGDLNGDTRLDLVTANSTAGTISVLTGNGDGSFSPKVDHPVGTRPNSVAIGDLDSDGNPDLAVANGDSDNVSVLTGTGDGSFDPQVVHDAGNLPASVSIGDLDGDGNLDIVAASFLSGSVSVLMGVGDGSFDPQTSYGTGNRPEAVAIGDLDADGDADLAVGNFGSGNVSILRGNGDGTFAPRSDLASANGPTMIVIEDLNGDGDADLGVANRTVSNSVSVFTGNGDGTFNPRRDFPTGHLTLSIAAGELNGDNQPDLVAANNEDNNISVLLNATPPVVEVAAVASPTTNRTPSVSFTAEDAGSGIASVMCKVDDDAPVPCDSPYSVPSLEDGEHTVVVTATDNAGSTGSDSATFTVDATAPDTTITSGPSGLHKPGTTNDSTPTFEFTSTPAAERFDCKVDDGPWEQCDSPATTAPLSDGEHTFSVRATDELGNVEADPASVTFTVAPSCSLVALSFRLLGLPVNVCLLEVRQ